MRLYMWNTDISPMYNGEVYVNVCTPFVRANISRQILIPELLLIVKFS